MNREKAINGSPILARSLSLTQARKAYQTPSGVRATTLDRRVGQYVLEAIEDWARDELFLIDSRPLQYSNR